MRRLVSYGKKAMEPMELFCEKCGSVLKDTNPGEYMFFNTGSCDCGWGCCGDALPVNKPHSIHLNYRERKGA